MFGIPCDILNTDVETAAGNSVQATSSIGRPPLEPSEQKPLL